MALITEVKPSRKISFATVSLGCALHQHNEGKLRGDTGIESKEHAQQHSPSL
jgi:hypothetical protein